MPEILERINLRFIDNCLLFESRPSKYLPNKVFLTHLLADFAIRQMALEVVS